MQTETDTNTINETSITNDLHNGEIYLIKNKINGKCYVGQALCYTGSNNSKWGTNGRWKSHIREALSLTGDHCVALNNAIRKYGHDNFEVTTLVKCHKDELDEHEIIYIAQYDSIQPNGYNIKSGGYSSKNNESTIQKMSESHTGLLHSEKTKINISKGQLGNRREKTYNRKNPEDIDLPKYIRAHRIEDKIISYIVSNIPIGIDKKEYTNKVNFSVTKYGSKENALKNAIDYRNETLEKYKYIEEEIQKMKDNDSLNKVIILKEDKLKEKLPEYIYPIIEDKKLAGYFVDEIIDVQKNKPFPKRVFNGKTNRWNLDSAKKYVAILNYINEHKVDMSNFCIDEIDINDVSESFYEKYYLPKYFNIFRRNDVIVGFCINGFPSDKHKGGKYKKEFRLKTMKSIRTMDEAYEAGIEELNDLKKGYITI
jgi:group I intron endonuclease